MMRRALKNPLGICAVASLVFVVAFAFVAIARLAYPYDVEWMEGGVLMQAARIESGRTPYPAPSADFVAFLYPPLYSTLVAALGKGFGGVSYALGRGLSLAASVFSAGALAACVYRATRKWELATLTVGLEAALVAYSGSFHDLVRPDALSLAFVVGATWLVYSGRGPTRHAIAGVLLAAACFTKQTAVLAGTGVVAGVWLTRDKKDAAVLAGAATVTGALAFFLLERATGGWLSFYLVRGHQSHRFYRDNLGFYFFRDALHLAPLLFVAPVVWLRRVMPTSLLAPLLGGHLAITVVQRAIATRDLPHMYFRDLWYPHHAWAIPPLVIAALLLWATRKSRLAASADHRFWGAIFVGALAAAATGHATQWAFKNSLMPLAVLGVPFVVLVTWSLATESALANRAPWLVAAALAVQLGALWESPLHYAPTREDREAWERLADRLGKIKGKVMVLGHPRLAWEIGRVEHLHGMAIADLAALGGVPDLDHRLARHEWAAIVVDIEDDMAAPPQVVKHYRLAGGVDAPNMKTGTRCRPGEIWVPR